jgi:hypothetical protein
MYDAHDRPTRRDLPPGTENDTDLHTRAIRPRGLRSRGVVQRVEADASRDPCGNPG